MVQQLVAPLLAPAVVQLREEGGDDQRLIGKLGATPWTALSHADKVWQRSNRGGAIAVYKVGEKLARLEFWQCPLAKSPFFVTSMRGAIAVGAEPFAERVVISEIPEMTTPDGFALRVMW